MYPFSGVLINAKVNITVIKKYIHNNNFNRLCAPALGGVLLRIGVSAK